MVLIISSLSCCRMKCHGSARLSVILTFHKGQKQRKQSFYNCCTGIVSIKLIFPSSRIHVMCKKMKKKGIKNEKKKHAVIGRAVMGKTERRRKKKFNSASSDRTGLSSQLMPYMKLAYMSYQASLCHILTTSNKSQNVINASRQ